MASPESASNFPRPSCIHDGALWGRAQQLLSQHLYSPAGDSCANPRCGASYPCTSARTAANLRAASIAPFHKRFTALFDARSCSTALPDRFGPTESTSAANVARLTVPPDHVDASAVAPVDVVGLAVRA